MLWGNVQTESVWSVMGSARARDAVRGSLEAAASPGTSPARAPAQARSCFQGRDLQVNGNQALSEGRGRATWATFGQRGAFEAQVPPPPAPAKQGHLSAESSVEAKRLPAQLGLGWSFGPQGGPLGQHLRIDFPDHGLSEQVFALPELEGLLVKLSPGPREVWCECIRPGLRAASRA